MCHEWWYRRMEEREASRELWDEFEETRPLADTGADHEEAEITLEHSETEPVAAER